MRQAAWPSSSYILWLFRVYLAAAIIATLLFVIVALAISLPEVAIPECISGIVIGVIIGLFKDRGARIITIVRQFLLTQFFNPPRAP
jgi:hypothetical protein